MKNAQRLFDDAILAEEAGQVGKALRLYEKASTIAKDSPAPSLRWAWLLFNQGRWKDAIKVARQITLRGPKVYLAYTIIGESYLELGYLLRAERAFRQSLSVKPDPGTWIFLGSVLSRLDRQDEAEECLRNALTLDPEYEEAHYNLGCRYKRRGQFAQAKRHLRRAIEIDPKYSLAYAELGTVLLGERGRAKGWGGDSVKEAVRLLRKSISLDPNDEWAQIYLAIALWRLRRLKAADEQYRKFLELWPDAPLGYWCYGDFLAYEGKDASLAEKYIRKALEMDPSSDLASYHLGKHLLYWGRKEEGVRFLKKSARLGHSKAQELLKEIEHSNEQ